MITETERNLAYAEAQTNHPDPQLRPLLAAIYGPDLSRLRATVTREAAEAEGCSGVPGGHSREGGAPPGRELALAG